MHLYLDVDGTLLRRAGHARLRGDLAPADHLRPFLEWATRNFTCIWLTSRDRTGGSAAVRAAFRQAVGPGDEADRIDALLARVAPSSWCDSKAEAIDFATPFLWLDDAPEEESLALLERHGAMDCWVSVSVDQRADDLRRAMGVLERRILAPA
ncbi:MAG TPA: hypothetical protein VL974_06535 [Magnetospirillum sp.]|jgi:hypothetical protein|nr:hypothetical protein [Magnetospirillum sp.]